MLQTLVGSHLPPNRQKNAKGWWHFNAVCCHHRGHKPDVRSRGNLRVNDDGTMIYNCYNCGFKTGYRGGHLGNNFVRWMGYLGVPQEKINQAKLELLERSLDGTDATSLPTLEWFKPLVFPEVPLPPGARAISELAMEDEICDEFLSCLGYLSSRGRAVYENWNYHWTGQTDDKVLRRAHINKRIIIPFYHENRVVGWTARYCGSPPAGIPRYYNGSIPDGFLFNGDVLNKRHRKFVVVVEGPFDAIAIDGVAALGSNLNGKQVAWLNSVGCEKIVLPDRQMKNQDLIDVALEQGWSVAFPEWERGIKDAADASRLYGRLFTVRSILHNRTSNQIKIGIQRKMLRE